MSQGLSFTFHGATLVARPSGALYWPSRQMLVVSDLHLGRSERYARLNRGLLPPYEIADTLQRLEAEIAATAPKLVISLGDSFDDMQALSGLNPEQAARITQLTRAQDWLWITGNHDPEATHSAFAGRALDEYHDLFAFRHLRGTGPDVSGHLHPVIRITGRRWRCFVATPQHLILPAFGSYTGGLEVSDAAFAGWSDQGRALVCGKRVFECPLHANAAAG